ncbi:TPA: hypothetical protein QCN93_005047 [Bacillus pacificus]|nr:hypothetical protein [Bacillus pacificus]
MKSNRLKVLEHKWEMALATLEKAEHVIRNWEKLQDQLQQQDQLFKLHHQQSKRRELIWGTALVLSNICWLVLYITH